jgi:hypothetical protein
MKTLKDELKTAELRYYIGQLAALFFFGVCSGALCGWLIWK